MGDFYLKGLQIEGLAALWSATRGNEAVRVAILDGPVDLSHPAFAGAKLDLINTLATDAPGRGTAGLHGTHVASILFGQHDGPIKGIAPNCHGIIIPVFEDAPGGAIAPCSQIDLARAITDAIDAGAHIISVSAGQFSQSAEAHPLLARAVTAGAERGALIVAAAGNDGCACLHVPGALPSVLAVGAMNANGEPLDFSNWGEAYRCQGVLALGENVPGARLGGGVVSYSGTSVATPIVSGVAALLLSWQMANEREPDSREVRRAILESALGCEHKRVPDCARLLMGRLNVTGSLRLLTGGGRVVAKHSEGHQPARAAIFEGAVSGYLPPRDGRRGVRAAALDQVGPAEEPLDDAPEDGEEETPPDETEAPEDETSAATQGARPETRARAPVEPARRPGPAPRPPAPAGGGGSVQPSRAAGPGYSAYLYPSACACGGGAAPQLVYALGLLYYDFGTDARRDSLGQAMGEAFGSEGNPDDPFELVRYLELKPWDSAAMIWTLNDETTPIYAIQAEGPYAQDIYARLRQYFKEQIEDGVERVSIPGFLGPGKVRLYTGQEIPLIYPELRGMFNWTTKALVEAVCGPAPAASASDAKKKQYDDKSDELRSFLDRVYYDIRNEGLDPRDRAINYSATNAFNIEKVFERALKESLALDTIEVERSPICRIDSDCWDVKLVFFNPEKQFEVARKVYRFTVDVSDVVPVLVGSVRQWSIR
jgi:cyanobactin maturation PatA/PatG family protease